MCVSLESDKNKQKPDSNWKYSANSLTQVLKV